MDKVELSKTIRSFSMENSLMGWKQGRASSSLPLVVMKEILFRIVLKVLVSLFGLMERCMKGSSRNQNYMEKGVFWTLRDKL